LNIGDFYKNHFSMNSKYDCLFMLFFKDI
jgi:hypothetical protein